MAYRYHLTSQRFIEEKRHYPDFDTNSREIYPDFVTKFNLNNLDFVTNIVYFYPDFKTR